MHIGEYIGSYRVVSRLAEGGMGVVYEAINDQIGHRVAIKQLQPSLATDPLEHSRFLHEARIANLVCHPSLITIHEYGTLPAGHAYIVMEYLDGQTLTQRLQDDTPLSMAQTLRFARQIATALSAVHARGIVHRDLKPDNLMIVADPEVSGGQRVKILDFGLAKGDAGSPEPTASGMTRSGNAMGTAGYIAPEQICGAATVDGQADVYSLGVILYEVLSGSRPFSCHSDESELRRHITRIPPPLREWAPQTPLALADLVHAMLAKQPSERPTMREVVDQLHRLEEGESTVVPRSHGLGALSAVAGAICLLLGMILQVQAPLHWVAAASRAVRQSLGGNVTPRHSAMRPVSLGAALAQEGPIRF